MHIRAVQNTLLSFSLLLFGLLSTPKNALAQADPAAHNADGSAVILVYHRFGEDKYPSTNIRLSQFEAQLDYLEANNFSVIRLSELVDALQNQRPIAPKTVVITVDDAWLSVYENAFPRLQALGWPMTVFVNTRVIDQQNPSSMSWAQMREMQAAGIEFANHSTTHDKLIQHADESTRDWRARVTEEIQQAQTRLNDELDSDLKLLSYPYGDYSEALANLTQQLGYVGIAQNSGAVGYKADFRALMRFPMSETYGGMDTFKLKVATQFMPIQSFQPFDPIPNENPPRLTLTFAQPQKGLQCFNHLGEALTLNWLSDTRVQITSPTPLQPPRDRYACTQKTANNQWRWFSHPWVIQSTAE